jgi:hypothetical protein
MRIAFLTLGFVAEDVAGGQSGARRGLLHAGDRSRRQVAAAQGPENEA